MKRRIFILVGVVVFVGTVLIGCNFEKVDNKKIADLEYTICDESRLPKELVEIIDEKKEEPFRFVYRTRNYLYIVEGYGEQERNDLGVTLKELYRSQNAIFVDTELMSFEECTEEQGMCLDETTTEEKSLHTYPYIVIKCSIQDDAVHFK